MELKDWLNSINYNKDDLSEDIKSYPPYIINRCLSGHMDCIMFANEMNMYSHLDKDMQYYFYLNSLRKRKRFSPWIKKEKIEDIDSVKQYYGYSNEKAKEALRLLSESELNYIKSKLDIGGTK
tara:strand:+ start:417 stop:785 length:369 start_codon:yes stop_codon:yes gene_type:complete